MRLEQLVLFGPSDNFCVQFGPRVTVLAGLEQAEKAGMLQTLVAAMAGRLPNASVIFVDHAGRRVFADRSGATYADTGLAAPSLGELLGTDPGVVADLITLRPADLGLGTDRTPEAVEADLVSARAALEQVLAERSEATTFVVDIETWERELAQLDERIAHLPDEVAHWSWIADRDRLDQLRGELAALDRGDETDRDADARLLGAVEDLRSAGEAWAEASAAAEELALELGTLPPVRGANLDRVAATPDALPDGFEARVEDLVAAIDEVRAAEDHVARTSVEPEDPGDFIVYHLARVDQERLWAAHQATIEAQAICAAAMAAQEEQIDASAESRIEDAHQEVVRAQREMELSFRKGILGASALAVGALLAGQSVSIVVGVLMLLAAVGLVAWLIVLPRRALAMAIAVEEEALTGTEAGSWLGMHLRRIDHVLPSNGDDHGLRAALDLSAAARLDWEELSGGLDVDAVGEREEQIRAYAAVVDADARAARHRAALEALDDARRVERAARRNLVEGLDAYGLPASGAGDVDAGEVIGVLRQRIAAGAFARQALELQHQQATATTAGALLDRLLRDLGFTEEGDLAGRLERAIVAVDAARRRRQAADEGTMARDELEAEIARLANEVEQRQRIGWDVLPAPTTPPADRAQLMDQRRALSDRIATTRRPDLSDLDRRAGVAAERVRMLETERSSLAEGPTALRRRLADRIGRTTWIGPDEEALPLVIDDAFVELDPGELFKMLDMIVRLSVRTQIVLLTSDVTVARWARREAEHGVISLFEADTAPLR
jgi:hypothetical protein